MAISVRMAVGAQQLEIFEPVVVRQSVDVVDLHAEREPLPFGEPTSLAAISLEPATYESSLDVTPISVTPGDEQVGHGHGLATAHEIPTPHGFRDRAVGHSEVAATLREAVSLVVVPLDRPPVVTSRCPRCDAELACVVTDRGGPNAKFPSGLVDAQFATDQESPDGLQSSGVFPPHVKPQRRDPRAGERQDGGYTRPPLRGRIMGNSHGSEP
jgi:hypothetical protein